jgi:guanylate kinase
MVAKGELLEHARVFGNWYGTPRGPLETSLGSGRDVVTDIDWQGTQQLRETVGDDIVTIFVLPPDPQTLERRLSTRAEDSDDAIAERMAKASDEMSHWSEYNYVVINDDLDQCVSEVEAILIAERSRRTRQIGLADFANRIRDELTEQSSELRKRARQRAELGNR